MNSVTNADVRDDAFHGSRVAKSWLFFGFVMGFAGMIAACWILFAGFVAVGLYNFYNSVLQIITIKYC